MNDDQVGVCAHCDRMVVLDDQGRWIHGCGGYACRDRWGVVLSTSAERWRWSTVYEGGHRVAG